jgi:hypothetical protein
MPPLSYVRLIAASLVLLTCSCAMTPPLDRGGEADAIRSIERARLAALVAGDMATAAALHAEDFQLVDPGGGVWSKGEYLGALSSGQLDYIVWEPEEIAVRHEGRQAVIRSLKPPSHVPRESQPQDSSLAHRLV